MRSRVPDHFGDVRTGLVVLAVLALASTVVFFLDALQRAFVEGPELVVLAVDVEGLEPGATVWVAGSPAGRVTGISFAAAQRDHPGRVVIDAVLHRQAARIVRADAVVRIGSGALLAPAVVKLDPGSRDTPPYDFRDTLVATPVPDLDDFGFMADTARAAADSLIAAMADLRLEMSDGRGTLPSLARDRRMLTRLAARERAARAAAARWTSSALADFVADTLPRTDARRIADRLAGMAADSTGRISRRRLSEAVGPLSSRLERLAAGIDAAEGTIGRMVTDDELDRQIDRTRARLDSLRIDAASRPLRYLRFRLF